MSEEIPAEEYLDRNTSVRRREESSEFNPSEYSGESFSTRLTFVSQADTSRNSTSRTSTTADKRQLSVIAAALNDSQELSGNHSPLHTQAPLASPLITTSDQPEELMIPVSFDTSHV